MTDKTHTMESNKRKANESDAEEVDVVGMGVQESSVDVDANKQVDADHSKTQTIAKTQNTSTNTSTSTKIHPFFVKGSKRLRSSAQDSAQSGHAIQWKTPLPSLLIGITTGNNANAGIGTNTDGKTSHSSTYKLATFDLDGTLIQTKGSHVFSKSAEDWTWTFSVVPTKLKQLHSEGYRIVVFSNQRGLLKSEQKSQIFKKKLEYVVKALDNLPMTFVVGVDRDPFRKPGWSGFDYFIQHMNPPNPPEQYTDTESWLQMIRKHSFYVGDAAGRLKNPRTNKQDFSCSDRQFALNIGFPFHTPEEYFLENSKALQFELPFDPHLYLKLNAARPHLMPKHHTIVPSPPTTSLASSQSQSISLSTEQDNATSTSSQTKETKEIVLFVGSPASGKTTFFKTHFEPANYIHINQDTLKRVEKCHAEVEKALKDGNSCVVDNTNPRTTTRAKYIELARKHNASIRCFHFMTDRDVCLHNNAKRDYERYNDPNHRSVPPAAIYAWFNSREVPSESEGFDAVVEVSFKVSPNEKHAWLKHYH